MASQDFQKNELTKARFLVLGPENSHKITPIRSEFNEELNEFRQQYILTLQGPVQPYARYRKSAGVYRKIFMGLGLVFMTLMTIIFMNKANWICAMYIGCFATKTSMSMACLFLATAAFGMAAAIRAEKEAVTHHYKRAKNKIKRLYIQQCMRFGIKRFFYACTDYHAVQHAYRDALDKLQEIKESSLSLLSHVCKSKDLDSLQKERLFNQTLIELRDQFHVIIHNFKNLT